MHDLNRVACVEDDASIRMIIQLALADIGGFQVELFPSGRAALDGMQAFGPDLIVLDVMMPAMDGPETLLKLRTIPALCDTPAIFMTAKAQPAEIDHYKELGALDVFVKPFNPMDLAQRLRQIWSRHLTHSTGEQRNIV